MYRLKRDFPDLTIILNGGLRNLDQAEDELRRVDGVMIGRAAYENPYLLADADRRFSAPMRRRRVAIESHSGVPALCRKISYNRERRCIA